jgi:glycosyltransferase involved in cell wall biosynthesis
MTALSIVVPTRNRPELLADALKALDVALRPGDELIVVDSASTDPRVRDVAEAVGARYVRCDRPGAALARNAGWRAARNELIAFTDDDVRVDEDWPDQVDAVFAAHPDVAFVTGRVLEPPDETGAERPVAIKDDPEPYVIDARTRGHLGQTANTGVRRSAMERIAGFDEQLGPGGPLGAIAEDVDLYDRLLGAGYVGRYDPSVLVYHVQWRARTQLLRLDWHYGLGSGYRVAKVWRLDRRRARLVARAVFWDWGLDWLFQSIRKRHEMMTVYALVRLAGIAVGLARGLVMPIEDGHLVPRSRRRQRRG